ncbi:MAG: hypothetical protein HPY59_11830 [Anaerolineae bacterium]|nr:hypothetical protein [Anaerolineae bacterium]
MNAKVQFYLRLFFVVIALTGFSWLFVSAFIQTIQAAEEPPVFSEPFTIAATTLAGLVGGVASIGLGASPPEKAQTLHKSKITQRFLAFGIRLAPNRPEDLQFTLAAIYAALYTLIGLAAWVIWISKPQTTPALVKDLAGIVLGLGVAVVQSFFGIQTSKIAAKKRH